MLSEILCLVHAPGGLISVATARALNFVWPSVYAGVSAHNILPLLLLPPPPLGPSPPSKKKPKKKTHNSLPQRTPLRAHPDRIARILDIGACDELALFGKKRGADAEVRVGA